MCRLFEACDLTDQDLDSIAGKIVTKIEARKRTFWVEPEQHYREHQWLGGLRSATNGAVKVVGSAVILAAAGGIYWLITLGKGIK